MLRVPFDRFDAPVPFERSLFVLQCSRHHSRLSYRPLVAPLSEMLVPLVRLPALSQVLSSLSSGLLTFLKCPSPFRAVRCSFSHSPIQYIGVPCLRFAALSQKALFAFQRFSASGLLALSHMRYFDLLLFVTWAGHGLVFFLNCHRRFVLFLKRSSPCRAVCCFSSHALVPFQRRANYLRCTSPVRDSTLSLV